MNECKIFEEKGESKDRMRLMDDELEESYGQKKWTNWPKSRKKERIKR